VKHRDNPQQLEKLTLWLPEGIAFTAARPQPRKKPPAKCVIVIGADFGLPRIHLGTPVCDPSARSSGEGWFGERKVAGLALGTLNTKSHPV
jgi:hypothetical protein